MLSTSQRNALHYWVQNKYGISLGATLDTTQPEDIPDAAGVWVADDIAQADASAVTTWTDRVQGITVTAPAMTNEPVYRSASSIGSQPAVDFDGSNDTLSYAGKVSTRGSGHIFAVVRFDNIASERLVLSADGASALLFGANSFGTGSVEINLTGPNTWEYSGSNTLTTGTNYLIEVNSPGTPDNWEFRINGAVIAANDVILGGVRYPGGYWFDAIGTPNSLSIGSDGAFGVMDGLIAAVIVIGKDPVLGWKQGATRW